MGKRIRVTFYTRPGCGLCRKAREVLRECESAFPLLVEEINILRDAESYARYKHTIPVVLVEGCPPLESFIDRQELRRVLQQAQKRRRDAG